MPSSQQALKNSGYYHDYCCLNGEGSIGIQLFMQYLAVT